MATTPPNVQENVVIEAIKVLSQNGDSGRCRSVFRGMPITGSGMMAITIPG